MGKNFEKNLANKIKPSQTIRKQSIQVKLKLKSSLWQIIVTLDFTIHSNMKALISSENYHTSWYISPTNLIFTDHNLKLKSNCKYAIDFIVKNLFKAKISLKFSQSLIYYGRTMGRRYDRPATWWSNVFLIDWE